ncbi:RNA polymerase sigma factor (sigma-70 family) [Kitasatospora gansuensis]|uniref:RNA polymerase sigma factor (Sigma-70 family) n=1 Tax=Kitasatospora gansuensis TaxID=258050 RepID=A0A7W7S7H4_9ACTN|nr:sigma-70 family RNA polymerase sigma factor [Kitasatospora gansuensis]MBB4944708.1 RNA polymerase sigma factor (sigma-70 family) [Kitasatospora gansuensis]
MDRYDAERVVTRAQAGEQQATDELIGAHLPLVYNIVGRALNGHPDTDDVVQETMLRAVDHLPSLRDPAGFRSWLVAIAMNQIRRRHQVAHQAQIPIGLTYDSADPGADFVDLTITRLGLAGQRREVAEATRWLDQDDRELLSLWWLEAAGELSRAELAEALELSPQHAAVRVQRMKGQLETARVVVRALAVQPPCPQLGELTAQWDGAPGALWRKRIARHARECGSCAQQWEGLFPAEGLLAGLALVPVPQQPVTFPVDAPSEPGATLPSTGGRAAARRAAAQRPGKGGGGRRRAKPRARRRVLVAVIGTTVATVAAVGVVGANQTSSPQAAPRIDGAATAAISAAPLQVDAVTPAPAPATSPPAVPASPSATPTASPSPTPTPTPAAPSPARTSAAPPATPSPATSAANRQASAQQQVLDLVNSERSKNNCGPVKANSKLQAAAQGHSQDMAARNFFDHTNPDGNGPQPRIEAAGYRWSTWGENIARGQQDAAAVMDAWMKSPGHRANILNCAFTEMGLGTHFASGGPWWTQNFGAPA